MALTALLCTDGSDLAHDALAAGLAVLRAPDRIVIATAIEPGDPTLVVGTGMAAGVITDEEFEDLERGRHAEGRATLEAARTALGLAEAELMVVEGDPGRSLCELATAIEASVIVMGTRGRSGLRRAVLGSVSDHIVRNAPCPVLTTGPSGSGS
jgi:nucleotide-binding universal stress UspA family protein